MLKVRVVSGEVFSRKIHSQKHQKDFIFRDQMAVLEGESPQPFKLSLAEDQAAYPPGEYEVLPASFYVDRDNKLTVGKLALKPSQVAGGAAGAAVAGVASVGARPAARAG
jgi:hypothetical protein